MVPKVSEVGAVDPLIPLAHPPGLPSMSLGCRQLHSPNLPQTPVRSKTRRGELGPIEVNRPYLRSHMNDNLMKASDAGEWATVLLEFLDFAFAVGGANHKGVIVSVAGLPVVAPEGPGQFRSGINNFRVGPGFAVVVAELDPRNSPIPAERDAFDFDGPT